MSEDVWFGPGELWHRLSPWAVDRDEVLTAIRSYLSAPGVQSELDNCEREHRYPAEVRQRLHDLGLWTLFADLPGGESSPRSKVTIFHQSALSQLIAVVNTSLAIGVGVTPFAFLPFYIAGSEQDSGTDLLGNRVAARPGLVDKAGLFQTWKTAPTHYQVSGRKDLINGGSRHELLTLLVRTRDAGTGGASERAGARDFSLLVPDSVAAAERVLLPLCAAARDRYLKRSTATAAAAETAQPPAAAQMQPASPRLTDSATPSVCALSDTTP